MGDKYMDEPITLQEINRLAKELDIEICDISVKIEAAARGNRTLAIVAICLAIVALILNRAV